MRVELPITSQPAQEWVTRLGEVKYLFRLQYNTRADRWTLDILTEQGEPLALGIGLSIGVDLLASSQVMPGLLYLVDYSGADTDPGVDLSGHGLIWSDGQ